MKIKKRLKYKSTLPKADFGMDPNALSNMNKQAAEETPAQGGGMGAAGAMNMATQGLNFVSAFTPQDNNDGIGMSHKASKITSGISTGLDTAASATSSIPIVGAAIGGVSALFKMIKGAVDYKRENDRSITSRLARKEYDPTQDNVGYSFGNSTAKYGMPLFGDGGKPIYTSDPSDKRLQAYNDSSSLFNKGEKDFKFYNNVNAINNIPKSSTRSWNNPIEYNGLNPTKIQPIQGHGYYFNHNPDVVAGTNVSSDKVNNKVFRYKKPVQPVILKPVPRAGNINIRSESLEGFKNGGQPTTQDSLLLYNNQLLKDKFYKNNPNYAILKHNEHGTSNKDIKSLVQQILNKDNSKAINYLKSSDIGNINKNFVSMVTKQNLLNRFGKVTDNVYSSGDILTGELDGIFNPNAPASYFSPTILPQKWNSYGLQQNTSIHQYDVTDVPMYDPIAVKPVSMLTPTERKLREKKYPNSFGQSSEKPVKVPVPKKNFNNLKEKQNILGDNIQYQNEPIQEESKGKPLNDFLKQERKNPNGGINTYIRKDIKSPWLQQDFELGGDPNVDNILKTNQNLDWVKRLYEDNTPSITLKGQTKPSTHFMEYSDNLVYPTIVRNADGKLEYLGDKARDYAVKTNTAIKLANEQDAAWFGENYKKGTGVLKGFALGGDPRAQSNIEAEQGEAMQHSSGKIENIEGQKHENGGTPLQVQPSHEYIYSDSLGYDREGNMTLDENLVRYSFADNAKKIERKYKGREMDSIVQKTKELELGKLKQDAEQARVAKEEIEMGKQMKKYKAKYGANLKRFDNSGNPQPSSTQPSSIMTPEEMKKMYDDLHLKAAGVTGGLNQTITDLQQTSKQLDNTNQQLQQSSTSLTKPTINKPLYNTLDTGDYFYEPTKLQTSWGTYGTDGNLIQKQSVIQPTPQPLFGGGNRINPFGGPGVPSRRDNLREAANFYTPGQVGTPRMATPSIDQRSTAPEVADKVKNGMFSSLTTGDKMQLASMLPAFGFNMGMGLRKADVEPNRKNLYEKDVVNIMQNRKFDIQNYLNQSNLATNTAKEDIGNNSTSVGGKMANLQKLFANQSNALGDITTKGQEMNNQYRAEEANTKNIIGEANRAESIRAAGINDQNKARKQQFLAKAFEQMGQGLATTGQAANQSTTNKLLLKTLSEISPDFNVKNMKDIERMSVDKDSYIVFDGVKTEFKMSDEGKIVMAGGTPNTANAAKSQYAPKDFAMKAFANFTKTKTKG